MNAWLPQAIHPCGTHIRRLDVLSDAPRLRAHSGASVEAPISGGADSDSGQWPSSSCRLRPERHAGRISPAGSGQDRPTRPGRYERGSCRISTTCLKTGGRPFLRGLSVWSLRDALYQRAKCAIASRVWSHDCSSTWGRSLAHLYKRFRIVELFHRSSRS